MCSFLNLFPHVNLRDQPSKVATHICLQLRFKPIECSLENAEISIVKNRILLQNTVCEAISKL